MFGLEKPAKPDGTVVGVVVLPDQALLTPDGFTICEGEVGAIELAKLVPFATSAALCAKTAGAQSARSNGSRRLMSIAPLRLAQRRHAAREPFSMRLLASCCRPQQPPESLR